MINIFNRDTEDIDFKEGCFILVDKPLDWTSFDVVNKLRYTISHYLGVKKIKVGHAGTLDPLATGLLIIAVGKYTKKLQSIQDLPKAYEGSIKFGASTNTYDAEGEEIPGKDPAVFNMEDVKKLIPSFTGAIMQVPPIFSAIKIKGQKAYSVARRGKELDIPARPVTIYSFEVSQNQWPIMDFHVQCSKGTYIRSLAHDLGKELTCGGYLVGLRRTEIGEFHVDNAWNLKELVLHLGGTVKEDQ